MEWRAEVDGLLFANLSPEEANGLKFPFGEDEALHALNEMNGDKAPSLDGFTIAFWQNAQIFVKEDIMEMFREFHVNGTFTKNLNATFIVLIPKKGGAEGLRTLDLSV